MTIFARWLQRLLQHSASPREAPAIQLDDDGLTQVMRNGEVHTVHWNELAEVSIVTTDDGPLADDVFWVLSGERERCVVPGSAEVIGRLLRRLQALPGFRNDAVIDAMGSSGRARFVCWQRDTAH
ncbi:hypothetical protein SAMN02745857_03834 [Andreprevotia lacus DSM 23236]|jgi:hypothetical protein|uniref:Uncharacterized protein n=1 Tax=Andreprevotia lacus DSM 23236 TaxID=1121001 RepID=A0A1W1XZU1_9NEIS|nr:hypothetical protein [Andreprevotia lacus]SMC29436.1 hypothetical protein SAMN02745857_03834 [Andreprevotia lacus DSM 23236]